MVSKKSQVINNLLSFFWWYINFLSFIFFFFALCFSSWTNFTSYFISNQISCSFYSFFELFVQNQFLQYLFLFLWQYPLIFYHIYQQNSCKWQKAIFFSPNLGGGSNSPHPNPTPQPVGFLLKTQNAKSCNPGIVQHSVTFY